MTKSMFQKTVKSRKKETYTESVLDYLKRHKDFFKKEYGIKKLGIFGSVASGEHTLESDLDIIIEMEKNKKNIHNFFRFRRFLESELGRNVDLGFENALRPFLKEQIKKNIIYV